MGGSKNWEPLFAVPIIRIIVYWGLFLGNLRAMRVNASVYRYMPLRLCTLSQLNMKIDKATVPLHQAVGGGCVRPEAPDQFLLVFYKTCWNWSASVL